MVAEKRMDGATPVIIIIDSTLMREVTFNVCHQGNIKVTDLRKKQTVG